MNRADFNRLRDLHYEQVRELNEKKGHDYAGEEDVLGNFEGASKRLGISEEKIWAVYADKHWQAVMTYCREGQVASEPIEERLHDVILYCFLLLGLIEDERHQDPRLPEHRPRNAHIAMGHLDPEKKA